MWFFLPTTYKINVNSSCIVTEFVYYDDIASLRRKSGKGQQTNVVPRAAYPANERLRVSAAFGPYRMEYRMQYRIGFRDGSGVVVQHASIPGEESGGGGESV